MQGPAYQLEHQFINAQGFKAPRVALRHASLGGRLEVEEQVLLALRQLQRMGFEGVRVE